MPPAQDQWAFPMFKLQVVNGQQVRSFSGWRRRVHRDKDNRTYAPDSDGNVQCIAWKSHSIYPDGKIGTKRVILPAMGENDSPSEIFVSDGYGDSQIKM